MSEKLLYVYICVQERGKHEGRSDDDHLADSDALSHNFIVARARTRASRGYITAMLQWGTMCFSPKELPSGAVLGGCLLAVLALALLGVFIFREWTTSFFSSALQQANVIETVSVQGGTYHVDRGFVSTSDAVPVQPARKIGALRLAYALTLAKRSPLIALAGTDADKLDTATTQLEAVQNALADLQSEENDKRLIRNTLFPIRWLRALADTERARQAFLTNSSDQNETRYRAALEAAAVAFESDLSRYRAAFAQTAIPSQRIAVMSGIETTESILHAIDEAGAGMQATGSRLRNRERCLSGLFWFCGERDLAIPALDEPRDVRSGAASRLPADVNDMLDLYAAVFGLPALKNRTVFAISDDSCIEPRPLPHYFVIPPDNGAGVPDLVPPMLFVGDTTINRIVEPSANWRTFNQYLLDLGVKYTPGNPISYYQCPELRGLQGHIFGIDAVFEEIQKDPSWAKRFGHVSVAGTRVISDGDITAFLASTTRAASGNGSPSSERDLLTELSLMVKNRSAALDRLVAAIATIDRTIPGLKQYGIHEGFDANYLLIAKSGFPQLFETQNPSVVGTTSISVFVGKGSPRPSNSLWYSQLPEEEKITAMSDLKVWVRLHREFLKSGVAP